MGVIFIPAFELSGTYDGSAIIQGLQQLQNALSGIKAPKITPQIDAGSSISSLKSQFSSANFGDMLGGLKGHLTSGAGDFGSIGKNLGGALTSGMSSGLAQFGVLGSVASDVATALGPTGIAIAGVTAAVGAFAVAATGAASAWEDTKTSIGRTTGLGGSDLEDMMSQLQDLRQEMGITAEAAGSLVEQAGSIGVGQAKLSAGDTAGYKQEIVDFAKATATLQGAWGMAAEATSSGIGKMGSVTLGAWNKQREQAGQSAMSWSDYAYKVGGMVDSLANSMGSSEEEIVTAMRNSSGAVAKWAPSEESYGKWLAMSSFLIDTGDSAGEAGTKIERLSQKVDENSAGMARVMGIDEGALRTKLKTDFMGTIQEFGTEVANMPESARPDLNKMFGLEGGALMGKVVADAEQGTGKLQSAFNYAANGTNVSEGYKAAADNASKAGERIGQAWQVSLEKVGGQILPIYTAIAGGIADVMVGINTAGTGVFDAFKDTSAVQNLTAIGSTVMSTFSTIASTISGTFSTIGTSLNSAMGGNALGSIAEIITTPLSIALGLVSQLVSLIGGGAVAGFQAISAVITAVVSALQTASAYIKAFADVTGISKAFDGARNAIDDIIDKVSEIGEKISSGLTDAWPKVVSGLETALGDLASQFGSTFTLALSGPLSDISKALGLGDLSQTFADINTKAQEYLKPAVKDSVKTGMEEGSKDAKNQIKVDLTDSAKAAAEEFSKANDEYAKAHTSGMSLSNQYDSGKRTSEGKVIYESGELRIIGGQQHDSALTLSAEETFMSFLDKFTVSKVWDKGGETGKITVLDSSGNVVSVGGKPLTSSYLQGGNAVEYQGTYDKAVKELKEKLKNAVTDFPKYLADVDDEISSKLESILSDGVVSFTEKDELGNYIASLDQLQVDYPVEFNADKGIQKLKEELKQAKLGVNVDLTGKLETDYTLWQSQHAAEYVKIFESTSKTNKAGQVIQEGINPWKEAERELHESLIKSTDRVNDLYGYIDTAVNSGDVADIQNAYAAMEELGKIKPEILGLAATQYRLQSLQEQYAQVIKVNKEGKLYVLGDSGTSINAYVDPQTAAKILGGGFLTQSMGYANLNKLDNQLFTTEYYATKLKASGRATGGLVGGIGTGDITKGLLSTVSIEAAANSVLPLIQERIDKEQRDVSTSQTALADTLDSLNKSLSEQETTYETTIGNKIAAENKAITSINNLAEKFDTFSTTLASFKLPSMQVTPNGMSTGVVYSGSTYTQSYSKNQHYGSFSWDNLINSPLGYGIPAFAEGAVVNSATLAVVGEKGKEFVISEKDLKGLFAKSVSTAKVGSIDWILNDQWFQYLAPKITMPTSYPWAKYPSVPNVIETGTPQVAWLSDTQKSAKDVYSGQIREAQLKSIGNSQVIPWFARGFYETPTWLSDKLTELSPKYESVWRAAKGGVVKGIVESADTELADTGKIADAATSTAATKADIWSYLMGENLTEGCIETVKMNLDAWTPGERPINEFERVTGKTYNRGVLSAAKAAGTFDSNDVWNAIYDNSGTCIGFAPHDSGLDFKPTQKYVDYAAAKLGLDPKNYVGAISGVSTSTTTGISVGSTAQASGITVGSTSNTFSVLKDIESNTKKNTDISKGILEQNSQASISAASAIGSTSTSVTVGDDKTHLVSGLSKNGYVVTYDPRTDTCEGLAFNPPDPSLKTTDLFYTGPRAGGLVDESYDEGYGWGGKTAYFDYTKATSEQIAEYEAWLAQRNSGKTGSTGTAVSNKASYTTGSSDEITAALTRIGDYAKGIDSTVTSYSVQGDAVYAHTRSTDGTAKVIAAKVGNIDESIQSQTDYVVGGQIQNGLYTALVASAYWGGGSGGSGYGGSYGSFFGGWLVSPGSGPVSSGTGWGVSASNAAKGSGSGSYGGVSWGGSIQYAAGGLVDSPEFFMNAGQLSVRGEAGPELILPLNDRRRTAELLRQYLPRAKAYAKGGMVGGQIVGNATEIIAKGAPNMVYAPTINGSGLSEAALQRVLAKERNATLKKVQEMWYKERR